MILLCLYDVESRRTDGFGTIPITEGLGHEKIPITEGLGHDGAELRELSQPNAITLGLGAHHNAFFLLFFADPAIASAADPSATNGQHRLPWDADVSMPSANISQ